MSAPWWTVSIYRSKPHAHQAPGGYWFVRVMSRETGTYSDVTITLGKAAELRAMGVPQLEDGGGL